MFLFIQTRENKYFKTSLNLRAMKEGIYNYLWNFAMNMKRFCDRFDLFISPQFLQHSQHLTINSCFSQRFILQRISLLSWHWNRVGSKSGPMASKHWGLLFSKSGNSRQVSRNSVPALETYKCQTCSIWELRYYFPMLRPSYWVIITETARQGDVLGVCQAILQWQGALGRGNEVWVGETELHCEPVLKIIWSRRGERTTFWPLSDNSFPWRCSRGRCPGGGPTPSPRGSRWAPPGAWTGAGPGEGRNWRGRGSGWGGTWKSFSGGWRLWRVCRDIFKLLWTDSNNSCGG